MAKLPEMSKPLQLLGGVLVVAIVASVGLYMGVYRGLAERNRANQAKLQARIVEINSLRPYENKLAELDKQIEELKTQLENMKHIVPDEEDADEFIHLMQNTAQSAGIEIRRWTAKPVSAKEFYTEVPFDLELDGPYYSVLNFFDRVAKLERIINVSNLTLGAVKSDNKLGHGYHYGPRETVVAICTSTTFFSRENQAPPPPAGKPGAPQGAK